MKYFSRHIFTPFLFLLFFSVCSQPVLAQVSPGPDRNNPLIKKYTLLVVLTHVDDYISIAPLLSKYSIEGHQVYYAIFNGVLDSVLLVPGGKKREELICAAKILGINEPVIFIGPAGTAIAVHEKMAENTIQLINQIKPDVMITWGPDGLTGHPRHILVGNIVTRVFQQQNLLKYKPRKLYYIAYPQNRIPGKHNPIGKIANEDGPFGTVPEEFISTIIEAGYYLKETRAAIACHTLPKGKLNKDWQEAWYIRLSIALEGKVFLRRVFPLGNEKESDVFQNL